ncbi:MAG: UDP-glucose dehydrogenase family protein [Candidatus Zixiibacteriota bacterium]
MDVSVIGTGYVGLVTAACMAEMGHNVVGVDHDVRKIEILEKGGIPIYEKGLLELVTKNVKEGRLRFSTELKEGVDNSEIIFLAVNTPTRSTGETDLTAIKRISRDIGKMLDGYRLIVVKSTVPVNTGKWLKKSVSTYANENVDFDVASNPEFLREGVAVGDFLEPDRVVIGVETERAREMLLKLYEPIDAKKLLTDIESAEIIKHASNTFLAMKISFINGVANICERSGADVNLVAEGMGLDPRIGSSFLNAGIGWGGACFPKDVKAFENIAQKLGYDFRLLDEIQRINRKQQDAVIIKLREIFDELDGKKIGLLGLAFKPNTDDMRNAPSIRIANLLDEEGVELKGYDPQSMEKAGEVMPMVKLCKDKWEVVEDVDAVILCTEWQHFRDMDIKEIKSKMRGNVIIDGRNIWDPEVMKQLGFVYRGVGRG